MSVLRTGGFTIIETMLFLAISGILIVAMVTGVGASINIQRYRDAVETFKSFLQLQYSELSNVENDRLNDWACDDQAKTIQSPTSDYVRGQSDCVLLGRYVTIVDDTTTVYTVVGHEDASATDDGDKTDIESLKTDYILNVSAVNKEVNTLEWGTRIAWPREGREAHEQRTPRSLALLFVRSPASGQVYTFSDDKVPDIITAQTFRDMLAAGDSYPGQGSRTICIDTNGIFVNADYSVFLNAFASGPTAVESRSDDFITAKGENVRCS